jgi:predicted ATPase with chaperone activity
MDRVQVHREGKAKMEISNYARESLGCFGPSYQTDGSAVRRHEARPSNTSALMKSLRDARNKNKKRFDRKQLRSHVSAKANERGTKKVASLKKSLPQYER